MLEPQERRLLHEALRPPVGFDLDAAIATTFSLDLVTLLGVPLAFTSFAIEDDEGRADPSPLALLESARRHAERISVYCQSGQIAVPARQQRLLAFLEGSVMEVMPSNPAGVFHPKLWVLRYTQPDQDVRYRVVCLSRNLTASRTWDVSLVLEGTLRERQVGYSRNRPLSDFIAALPALAIREIGESHQHRAAQFGDELRMVDFELPDGFEELAFYPLGISGYARWPFRNAGRRLLVVSPFLSDGCLDRLAREGSNNILVSRLEELAKVSRLALDGFPDVYVLREQTTLPSQDAADDHLPTLPEERLSGLHAKLYIADDAGTGTVWIGSANATNAAFGHNIEFLVSLAGPRRLAGIDAILRHGEGEPGLLDLLTRYEPQDAVEVDETQVALEHRLDEVRRSLASAPLVAEVYSAPKGGHGLRVRSPKAGPVASDPTATVRIWPITLPEAASRPWSTDGAVIADFGQVTLVALTSFFAVRVELTDAGRTLGCGFVLNLPLEGAPEARRSQLVASFLEDRQAVTRFLLFLLSGDTPTGNDGLLASATAQASAVSGTATDSSEAVLELLLARLHRDPGRLDHVEATVRSLLEAPDGRERLPDGFVDVWEPIWEARQALRREVEA